MTPRSAVSVNPRGLIGVLILLHLVGGLAAAQRISDPFNNINSPTNTTRGMDSHGGTIVLISVFAEDGKTRLDRQAVVKATNKTLQTVNWKTTDEKSSAAIELPFGTYDIEISAVGYLSEVKQITAAGAFNTIPIDVALHPDPTAVDLRIADADMPPKARKEAKQAVSALKSGNLKSAKKKLDEADKLAPLNSDLNYLLGYLSYQEKDLVHAQSYLATAARLNAHHVQALTLLGRVGLMQEDYLLASDSLVKAVDIDPDHWMAHNLLADVYLKQKKYESARHQAALALEKGGAKATTANLALGQALVNLGKDEEGIQALKIFVQDSPKNPTVPQVRDLIATLEKRDADPAAATEAAQKNRTSLSGVDPLLASPEPQMSVKTWQPPGIDEGKPVVAEGVGCPVNLMEMTGERVKELVDDVSRIAAIEHLMHQRVDEMGNATTRESRDYNYVASISEDKPGFLEVDENRSERLTRFDFPDEIATSGFTALALVFHPNMQQNYEMTCEGLGSWHGQAAWLVHFKQRPDRPARIQDYKVGGEIYSLHLKGRAWITADKCQIVRIESELVAPMMNIQLRNEQQIVEYGPVRFQGKKNVAELWLPQKAQIYLDFRKKRYIRSHSYDHYMVFSVESEEKRNESKLPPNQPIDPAVPN